jgi:hypothetical protein
VRLRERLADLRADLVIAVRTLWHDRGYSLVVAITLSLGIGSSSATFAAFHHVLLEPLPVRDQGKLAVLTVENAALMDKHVGITYRLIAELQPSPACRPHSPPPRTRRVMVIALFSWRSPRPRAISFKSLGRFLSEADSSRPPMTSSPGVLWPS